MEMDGLHIDSNLIPCSTRHQIERCNQDEVVDTAAAAAAPAAVDDGEDRMGNLREVGRTSVLM